MPGSSRVYFATSNDSKFAEARLVLEEYGIRLGRLKSKGPEMQSDDVALVASAAASKLAARRRSPFFVEDTALFVNSLRGFPGTYAAFVRRTIGLSGLLNLLSECPDRSAEFRSAVAFVGSSRRPRVFVGRLRGVISPVARGTHGFGFDPVFVPRGSSKTLAELTLREKCAISHRAAALRALGEWLVSSKDWESL